MREGEGIDVTARVGGVLMDDQDRLEEEYRVLKRETERQQAVMSSAMMRVAAMVAEAKEGKDES